MNQMHCFKAIYFRASLNFGGFFGLNTSVPVAKEYVPRRYVFGSNHLKD